MVRQDYLRLQVLTRLQPLQPLVRKLIVRLNVQRLKHLRKPLPPADFERRAQRRPKKVKPVLQVLPAVRLRKQLLQPAKLNELRERQRLLKPPPLWNNAVVKPLLPYPKPHLP